MSAAAPLAAKRSRKDVKVARWTAEEEQQLLQLVQVHGVRNNWGEVAAQLGSGRSADAAEQHYHWMHGTWASKKKKSPVVAASSQALPAAEEADATAPVAEVVTTSMPAKVKRGRPGCKLPRWTPEQDARVQELVQELGSSAWEEVATRLGGDRSVNSIKQRYFTTMGRWKQPKKQIDAAAQRAATVHDAESGVPPPADGGVPEAGES